MVAFSLQLSRPKPFRSSIMNPEYLKDRSPYSLCQFFRKYERLVLVDKLERNMSYTTRDTTHQPSYKMRWTGLPVFYQDFDGGCVLTCSGWERGPRAVAYICQSISRNHGTTSDGRCETQLLSRFFCLIQKQEPGTG